MANATVGPAGGAAYNALGRFTIPIRQLKLSWRSAPCAVTFSLATSTTSHRTLKRRNNFHARNDAHRRDRHVRQADKDGPGPRADPVFHINPSGDPAHRYRARPRRTARVPPYRDRVRRIRRHEGRQEFLRRDGSEEHTSELQ